MVQHGGDTCRLTQDYIVYTGHVVALGANEGRHVWCSDAGDMIKLSFAGDESLAHSNCTKNAMLNSQKIKRTCGN